MAMLKAANPWVDPPEGILDHIFSFLPSFADRSSCTGVCKAWRRYASEEESTAPPLLPCLLRPSMSGASCFHFFSRTITAQPGIPAARFCGSIAGGWFVVAHDQWRGYALLHLASGTQISLPESSQENGIPNLEPRVGLQPSALIILAATVWFPALTPDIDGDYFVVAAITFGQHKAVVWQPGMERWVPLELHQGMRGQALEGNRGAIMDEELEDVIYYSCDRHEGFYFLTSQEHLLVFDPEDEDGHISGDLDGYIFPDHRMAPPPETGHVVAGRYLVESDGRLLMVKRFVSPGQGTVSFQIFTLVGEMIRDLQWVISSTGTALIGKLLFVGRGCSRTIPTGRSGPGFIYFLDDAEGFPDEQVLSIVRSFDKEYRCSDAGWCSYYDPQYVAKNWPKGPPANCSPWTWLYH